MASVTFRVGHASPEYDTSFSSNLGKRHKLFSIHCRKHASSITSVAAFSQFGYRHVESRALGSLIAKSSQRLGKRKKYHQRDGLTFATDKVLVYATFDKRKSLSHLLVYFVDRRPNFDSLCR